MTQPMKVVRASGTIVSAEVSLGYDLARARVSDVMLQAALDAGLTDAFVHVRALGDFSVTYRVAGLLADVGSLISARSHPREHMLDALHGAGIEIVSPTFMNTGIGFSNAIGRPMNGPEKAPGRARRGPKYASLGGFWAQSGRLEARGWRVGRSLKVHGAQDWPGLRVDPDVGQGLPTQRAAPPRLQGSRSPWR